LHPTDHNPFPHPHTEDQLLVNIFLDITENYLHTPKINFWSTYFGYYRKL
jgi:hypothetical protein